MFQHVKMETGFWGFGVLGKGCGVWGVGKEFKMRLGKLNGAETDTAHFPQN